MVQIPNQIDIRRMEKNMTKLYAVYKRFTSNSITNIDSKRRDGEKHTIQLLSKQMQEWAYYYPKKQTSEQIKLLEKRDSVH